MSFKPRAAWLPLKFRAWLILFTTVCVALTIMLYAWFTAVEQSRFTRHDIEAQMQAYARHLAASNGRLMQMRDLAQSEEILLDTADFPGVQSIQITDPQGKLLGMMSAENRPLPGTAYAAPHISIPEKTELLIEYDGSLSDIWAISPLTGILPTHMIVWQPIRNGKFLGWVRVAYALDGINEKVRHIWKASFLAASIAIVANLLLLLLFLRRPVLALSEAVSFAATLENAQGRSLPLHCHIPEIQALGIALNSASKRLAKQQRELADTNDFLRSLTDTMGEGVYALDGNGRCTFLNREASRLLGWQRNELMGKNIHDTIHYLKHDGSPLSHDECLVHRSIAAGETFSSREEILIAKDGRMFPVAIVASPLFKNKRVEGSVAVFHDISRSKWEEADLRHAKELAETANRAKSEFLSNMSHEIRTPLTGIIGMTDLIMDTALSDLQKNYVKALKSSADALLSMVSDILDVSRIESGRLALESIDFSLFQVVGDAMKSLVPQAARKGLDFTWAISPTVVTDRLVGDPGRLRQVLINLAGNAIKYTEHGKVSLSVSMERMKSGSVCLRFDVRDSGIGIPTEKQDEIFNLFTQLDSSAARKYGGTGLGLSISKRLVEMMEGRLWVTSQVGVGSEFHFTAHFGRAALPDFSGEAEVRLEGVPVLVASDNATNRHILDKLLRSWGMLPTLAEDNTQALSALSQAEIRGLPYSLILLDSKLSGGDCGDVMAQLAAARKPGETRVIMLASGGVRGDAAHCRELGVSGYITKPVGKTELLQMVRTVLVSPPPADKRPLITRHVLHETAYHRDILLVEDNPVSQEMVLNILRRRGHRVTVADDGQEALTAFGKKNFDLILMDVQMPVMDGLEVTRIIRASEEGRGKHTPVVALTGNDAQLDREKCKSAGMDGFLSKPVRVAELLDAIARQCHRDAKAALPADQPAPPGKLVDIPALLEQVDGEQALAAKLADMFESDLPGHLKAVEAALHDNDAAQLIHAAHAVKGLIGVFSKGAAFEAARTLEMQARDGDFSGAQELAATLEHQAHLLERELAELAAQWRNEDI